jgi:hypothetical protein
LPVFHEPAKRPLSLGLSLVSLESLPKCLLMTDQTSSKDVPW